MRFFLSFILLLIAVYPCISHAEGYIVETRWEVPSSTVERKNLIEKVLESDAMYFGYSALSILIDADQREPRGKMQGKKITLSPYILRDGEFVKLLVHELGHYVDIYYLLSGKSGDTSDQFYSISWLGKTTKKPNQWIQNFVSGYAATDKYEDFAESFVFYMFHNREFTDRAMKNDVLRQKYLFFSNNIFPDGTFQDTDFRIGKISSYLWDTTKIPISLQKYLFSLQ